LKVKLNIYKKSQFCSLNTNQVIATISGISETFDAIIIRGIRYIYRFDPLSKLVAFADLYVKINQSNKF